MEDLENWVAAGEVAREVLSKALDIVEAGASLVSLAEALEQEIMKRGARPAFPVNLSVNHVAAHYSPGVGDDSRVPEGGVVKVDVGVHVDGCIADAAITLVLDPRFEPLAEAARRGLRAALSVLKPGVELCNVGAAVEATVRAAGYKPISNLSGHLMQRYTLHAGKHVPNVRAEHCDRAALGEVYAIEPFVTNGIGFVVEGGEGAIYRVVSVRKTGDENADRLLKELWNEYRGLPFSERWLFAKRGGEGLEALAKLVQLRRVYRYPVLVEAGGGIVAQFEDTVILLRDKVVNTTRVLELLKS